MLRGLASKNEMVKNAMSIQLPRDREAIGERVRNVYLNSSVQGKKLQ